MPRSPSFALTSICRFFNRASNARVGVPGLPLVPDGASLLCCSQLRFVRLAERSTRAPLFGCPRRPMRWVALAMTTPAKRYAVRHVEPPCHRDRERFDVVRVQPAAALAAVLAGVVVASIYRIAPQPVLRAVARQSGLVRRPAFPVRVVRPAAVRQRLPGQRRGDFRQRRVRVLRVSLPGARLAFLELDALPFARPKSWPDAVPQSESGSTPRLAQGRVVALFGPLGARDPEPSSVLPNEPPAAPDLSADLLRGLPQDPDLAAEEFFGQHTVKFRLSHAEIIPQSVRIESGACKYATPT